MSLISTHTLVLKDLNIPIKNQGELHLVFSYDSKERTFGVETSIVSLILDDNQEPCGEVDTMQFVTHGSCCVISREDLKSLGDWIDSILCIDDSIAWNNS